MPTTCGVGEYWDTVDGIRTPEYSTWKSIFYRSYSKAYLENKPTYVGCTVSPEWHCFQDFGVWTSGKIGWGLQDWQIDKDLLIKGNKVYGPDVCVMLPRKLNMLLVNRANARGSLPIGASKGRKEGCYRGSYKDFEGNSHSQGFNSPEEAFMFYKINKERVIQEAAALYRDQLDPRAYGALMAWEISIND
jgi:hypothetical protein